MAEQWEFRSRNSRSSCTTWSAFAKRWPASCTACGRKWGRRRAPFAGGDRLTEVDGEYELSLQSVSEKEAEIMRRGGTISLLQKR